MHNLDELRQKMKDAQAAIDAGRAAYREASTAYREAALEASGLKGHRVSYTDDSWGRRSKTTTFLVERVIDRKEGDWFDGRVILKDGRLGLRKTSATRAMLTDLGLYEGGQ